MALLIDNMDRFSDYLVTIKCGAASTDIKDIQGILTEDSFVLENSADFVDSDVRQGMDLLKGASSSLAGKAPGIGGVIASTVAKKFNSVIQSAVDWNGGSSLSFSVTFNVFRNKKNGVSNTASFKEFYENLVKLTQSKEADLYTPQKSHYENSITDISEERLKGIVTSKENTLFTVTIGKWFHARLLQPTSTNMVISTYTDTTGSPIYATVRISFQSYRILTSEEWSRIIRI